MTELQNMQQQRDAALSREKEANKDWSTATKGWFAERLSLLAEIKRLKGLAGIGDDVETKA